MWTFHISCNQGGLPYKPAGFLEVSFSFTQLLYKLLIIILVLWQINDDDDDDDDETFSLYTSNI